MLTSQLGDPRQGDRWWGVMRYVETAIRDPFFYRWHRHIDDQSARLQGERQAADLTVNAADVSVREGGDKDILLVFSDQVPDGDFDAFASERLCGHQFGDPDGLATDTLTTRFRLSRVTAPIPRNQAQDPSAETYWTTHLTHRPFGLFLRVEAAAAQHVTVLLAQAELAGDRRMWIELDKFDRQLEQGVNLIGRPDALSSVIRASTRPAPRLRATATPGVTAAGRTPC